MAHRRSGWGFRAGWAGLLLPWLATAAPAQSPGRTPALKEGSTAGVQGYGAASRGGADGEVYRVTSLADTGPGSLRAGVESRTGTPRTVIFEVSGTITLRSTLFLKGARLTVDARSAPAPGITLRKEPGCWNGVVIGAGEDLVVMGLRGVGRWEPDSAPSSCQTEAVFVIDGDAAPDQSTPRTGPVDNPRGVRRLVFAWNTITRAADSGADLWGDVQDVTFAHNLVYENYQPQTISYKRTSSRRWPRQRLSWYRNVYAHNGERQPQLVNGVYEMEYVNNIVYGWRSREGGYGLRFKGGSEDLPTSPVNVIGNAFLEKGAPDSGCVFGETPRGNSSPRERVTAMQLWFEDNLLPLGRAHADLNCFTTPTARAAGGPYPVPEPARVSRLPSGRIGEVLDGVGVPHRTATEQALVGEIRQALARRGSK